MTPPIDRTPGTIFFLFDFEGNHDRIVVVLLGEHTYMARDGKILIGERFTDVINLDLAEVE